MGEFSCHPDDLPMRQGPDPAKILEPDDISHMVTRSQAISADKGDWRQ